MKRKANEYKTFLAKAKVVLIKLQKNLQFIEF